MSGFSDSNTPDDFKNSWQTPPAIVAYWQARIGKFTLDVAADPANAVTPKFYTKEDNGLEQDWHQDAEGGIAWANPPYDNIKPWVVKAAAEAEKGLTTVMLVAGTHETAYVTLARQTAERVYFIYGGRIGYVHPITKEVKPGGRAPSFVFVFSPYAADTGAIIDFLHRNSMLAVGEKLLDQEVA